MCVHHHHRRDFLMHSTAWWPTLIVVAIATGTDLRWRRIPNWLVLPFLAGGLVVAGYVGGWHGLGQGLEGMALGTVAYGVLAWMGGMGMGDVKLVAAIGVWIGPGQLLIALVLTGLVGGVMALLWATLGGFAGELFQNVGSLARNVRERGMRPHPELVLSNVRTRKLPYAPAIAIGTLASFFAR
jgi:prepilin peptidase CpaA